MLVRLRNEMDLIENNRICLDDNRMRHCYDVFIISNIFMLVNIANDYKQTRLDN